MDLEADLKQVAAGWTPSFRRSRQKLSGHNRQLLTPCSTTRTYMGLGYFLESDLTPSAQVT